MRLDLNNLPTDPILLQHLVRDLADHVDAQQRENQAQAKELKHKISRIDQLEHQLAVLRRQRFGCSSEKVSAEQRAFWETEQVADMAEVEQALSEEMSASTETANKPPNPNKSKRQLPDHLPREHHTHSLDQCQACGDELEPIGEEVVAQLDYRPASFFVHRHVKKTYRCACCETAMTAALPPQPIDKGLPGAGLLAQVATAKFADHTPLHRQSNIYQREAVSLAVSTLSDWLGRTAWWLRPIVDAMKPDVLSSPAIHTDDTTVPVLEPGRGQTKTGRLWVYCRDSRFGKPCAIYEYTPTRSKNGPMNWLTNYAGYLQADAYPGYQSLYNTKPIIEVSCWSHARRKFVDIEKKTASPIAREAIKRIGELFAIESQLDDQHASIEQRSAARQQFSAPRLCELKQWLDRTLLRLSRRSPLSDAIAYLTKRWESFTRYTTDGHLLMHNNPAENALRGVVLGRKNYLFAGSDQGGERAAIFYSIIQTCKLNGIDPQAYLTDVLQRLPTHPANQIEELIPIHWQSVNN